MPNKYVRKQGSLRASWMEEDVVEAVEAVKEYRMGVNEAARYINFLKLSKEDYVQIVGQKGLVVNLQSWELFNERRMVHHNQISKLVAFLPHEIVYV
ncbi:hypothetical protein J6590_009088 [Homalodisca vitripennis]|nr:hypothetical protein J6590_009088 [Homalodisca vitripennis]